MSTEHAAVESLDLRDLHAANIARQAEWCPDQVPDLSFRGNELAGETGEACNVVKKLERERHGWRGSRASLDDLAQELADVVICADLCAVTAGIDLAAAVRAKFNATSEKQGLSTMLPAAPPAPTDGKLAHLAELSAKASPGEWFTEAEKCDGSYGSGEDTSEGYLAYSIQTDAVRHYGKPGVIAETSNSTIGSISEETHEDGFTAWDETARANTAFIVALVNAYRAGLLNSPGKKVLGTREAETREDREHARRVELQEIADGAYGDNPMVRGRARDALSAAAPTASPAPTGVEQGWQLIETAPKDGTRILVMRQPESCKPYVEISAWQRDSFGVWHWSRHGEFHKSWDAATHWMPLPAPPTPSRTGEG